MPRRCEMKSATAPPTTRRRQRSRRSRPTHRFGDEVELREPHRVGADAEVRAVAERRQPGVAEQQVEAEREDAPDQDLDAEIAVEPDPLIQNGSVPKTRTSRASRAMTQPPSSARGSRAGVIAPARSSCRAARAPRNVTTGSAGCTSTPATTRSRRRRSARPPCRPAARR